MDYLKYQDYRKFLYDRADDLKNRRGPQFNFGFIAKNCEMQNSYFSKVCSSQAHLNEDQFYSVTTYLELSEEEQEYFGLLFQFQRSSIAKRRKELRIKIDLLKEKRLKTENAIPTKIVSADSTDFNNYFLSPTHQIVHLLLGFSDEEFILQKVGLSKYRFDIVMKDLINLGLVTIHEGRVTTHQNNMFLSKDSPIAAAYHSLLKMNAEPRIHLLPAESKYALSVLFTADKEIFEELRIKFVTLIKDISDRVAKTKKPKELYQLSIDFFPWT